MMKSSPVMAFVGMACAFVVALVAIGVGLKAFNYDFMAMPWMQAHMMPLLYVILVAGLVSAALLLKGLISGCCFCCGGAHKH